jgi:hypothetical protein
LSLYLDKRESGERTTIGELILFGVEMASGEVVELTALLKAWGTADQEALGRLLRASWVEQVRTK